MAEWVSSKVKLSQQLHFLNVCHEPCLLSLLECVFVGMRALCKRVCDKHYRAGSNIERVTHQCSPL